MSGEHSRLPPSSAARRIQCPGSTLAEAAYPQTEDSPESIEGTAAHWAAAEMLEGRLVDVGQIAANGVVLTAEMVEGADLLSNDVTRELAPYGMTPLSGGHAERRVTIPRVHPESWGTPDYYAWPTRTRLLVYDYKFGHRVVDVFENAQLIEYVAGILEQVPSDLDVTVTAKIVQPRSFHRDGPIRSWTFRAADIRALVNIASYAAHQALAPNPPFRVGAECRDCRARHACPTLQAAALSACDVAGKAQPFDLPVPAMALEYRTLRRYRTLLDARLTGLEEQLLSRGKTGAQLPGLRIEHGAGRERWTVPDADVIAVGAALGVALGKPPAAMTPKQAVAAGLPAAVLPGLVNMPRGKAELVEDDGSLARRVFA